MGPPVTPSPTPPADERFPPSTPISIIQGMPASSSQQQQHGPTSSDAAWRYNTPPFEDRTLYDYDSPSPYPQHMLFSSSFDDSTMIGHYNEPYSHRRAISDSCPPKLRLRAPEMQISRSRRSNTTISSCISRPRSNTSSKTTRTNSGRITKKTIQLDHDGNTTTTNTSSSRRKTTTTAATLKVPPLTKPLSEYAKDFPHIQVENIEQFVNRSLEERQQEAAQAKKIKRELNPFLLYRKAHKNIAEALIRMHSDDDSHINPRISKLCGNSWKPLETDEFRAQYDKWSKIEKDRLKKAFPEYRYKPVKKNAKDDDNASSSVATAAGGDGSGVGASPLDDGGEFYQDSDVFDGDILGRRARSFTPFSQMHTPPPVQSGMRHDVDVTAGAATPWMHDYAQSGDVLTMDHLAIHTGMHNNNNNNYMGSQIWESSYRDTMSPSPAPHNHHQGVNYAHHQPPPPHQRQQQQQQQQQTDAGSIDPRLIGYHGGMTEVGYPNVNIKEERMGQGWVASVPGGDHYVYMEGGIDDWELGTGCDFVY